MHRLQGWRVPDSLLAYGGDVVLYGEPLMAEAVADQMGLALLEPEIDWLTRVPFEHVSREIQIMTLGEARLLASSAFVKPADGKIFDPRVYATGADLPSDGSVDQDIPVLRSSIMDFRLEVRCFIADRQIVSMSPYWRDGVLARTNDGGWPFLETEEPEARGFAEQVLADQSLDFPPGCTLDVGKTTAGIWAVIEANPSWGAGLYGCDPLAVMQAIRVAVKRRSDLVTHELRWISRRKQSGIQAASEG
ncbi:MAG TPA: ATP-grasp domain-containing protein [Prosthecobacter sp.]